jgi:hypothetical protein
MIRSAQRSGGRFGFVARSLRTPPQTSRQVDFPLRTDTHVVQCLIAKEEGQAGGYATARPASRACFPKVAKHVRFPESS